MKKLLAVFLALLLYGSVFGQSTFIKTIDATSFGRNVRVFQTSDQGIAVFSLDSLQLYKFNNCGDPEWAKQYTIPIGFYPGNIIQTQSGGFALLNRIPNGNTYQSVITLLNSAGNIVWSRSLEDLNYIQFPYTISEDSNGNFVVLSNFSPLNQQGYFNAISKLDPSGNLLWTKFYNFGPIWGGAIVTTDNGILARIGSTLFKTDNAGNPLWKSESYNTTNYLAPIEVSDGYIYTGINNTSNQICFYKIDKTGHILWNGERRNIDFTGNPSVLYKKNNGNFAGIFNKTISGWNYATLIEFDKDLNIVRQSTLNNIAAGFPLQGLHVGFSDENATVLAGLVIANAAGSKLFFAKTNNLLHTGCDTTFATNIVSEPIAHTLGQTTNSISQTFNLVNKPFPVKTIPAIITTLCSKLTPVSLNIHSDSLLCENTPLTLQDKNGTVFSSYLWSTGETTPTIQVTKPGKYWLRATYNCSTQTTSDTVHVREYEFPELALTTDTAVCGNKPVLLHAEIPGATYKWQDGSVNATYYATRPGTYEVEITLGNCSKKVSTQIGDFEKLSMPNIFTPNADGLNDAFIPMEMCGIASGTLKIYNRWGQLLFTTSDIGNGWNGRVNGGKSNDGIYFYLLEYTNFRNEQKKKKGWLEVLGH